MSPVLKRWYIPALTLAGVAVSVVFYSRLPEQMATHWGMDGTANGWMSRRVAAFFGPAMIAVLGTVLQLAPRLDPRRENYDRFRGAYDATVAAALLLLFAVHLVVLAIALGYPLPVERLMPIFVGVLLLFIGNLLPRARSNWLYGIRTPWTLSNERVWERTHRLAGYAMTAAGALIILAGALLTPKAAIYLMVGASLAAAIAPAAYSYFIWKKETS